jgi:NADPH:quinone reductase-like Zn-dependent oxidoreductase
VIGLARRRGLRVLADARPADEELVHRFGADLVVERGDSLVAAVREAEPDGVAAVYDTALLGRSVFGAIRDNGGIAVVRAWDGSATPRGIVVQPVFVRQVLERTDWLRELSRLASDGVLELRVAGTYPPERAADAQRAMEVGGLRGRALIVF